MKDQINQLVQALDGNISLQVSAIMRLITKENVNDVMDALPSDFRFPFLEFVSCFYFHTLLDTDAFVNIGSGTPPTKEAILAVRDWFEATILTGLVM